MGAPAPQFIPEAFAIDADGAHRNVIPDAPLTTQRASFQLGFPPLTMTPVVAGGKPMLGPDMNGILYMLSSHTYYQQAGQPYLWNADVVVAIGGYAAGTLLGSSAAVILPNSGPTLWLNLVDNNSSDPDAGGAGWVPMFSYGLTLMPASTGGVVTLTAAQAAKSIIVLSGALVANSQIVLPNSIRRWLIVNTTTGGFTTTVKTAAGTGVDVSQGGYSAPVEVYGNGTNIYPAVAPTVLPTSVAPTANTIPLRDGTGSLYAQYFVMNAGAESFTPNNVMATSGDGVLRRLALSSFLASCTLSAIGGQITNGQIPQSAVTQFDAAIWNDSLLTGTPTAPTPPAGNSSTRIATTAFVGGSLSIVGNTINVVLPGGLILKAGFTQAAGAGPGDVAVAFATAFPNACIAAVCCTANRNGAGSSGTGYTRNVTAAGFTMLVDTQQVGVGAGNKAGYWIAVGY